ncbi:hypothetical protein AZ041_000888 [Escherichia coli]|nr:hypothetical protein AZ041_000888 [Escherichia coli]
MDFGIVLNSYRNFISFRCIVHDELGSQNFHNLTLNSLYLTRWLSNKPESTLSFRNCVDFIFFRRNTR